MSGQRRLPRDEAEALFAELSRRARRRRRARAAGRLAALVGAIAVLGGSLIFALAQLRGLGPERPGSPVESDCPRPSTTVDVSVTETRGERSFDRSCLSVPADTPFVVVFRNTLRGSESLSIYAEEPTCAREDQGGGVGAVSCDPPPIFAGDAMNGPGTITYSVQALPAGTYYFQSNLHFDELRGVLNVAEA